MLIYKITYQKKYEGATMTKTKWAGSGKDAGSIRKNARQEHGYVPNSVQTAKIDVPTKKDLLIDWLNTMKVR